MIDDEVLVGRCYYAGEFKEEPHDHVRCDCPNCPDWGHGVYRCAVKQIWVRFEEIQRGTE